MVFGFFVFLYFFLQLPDWGIVFYQKKANLYVRKSKLC